MSTSTDVVKARAAAMVVAVSLAVGMLGSGAPASAATPAPAAGPAAAAASASAPCDSMSGRAVIYASLELAKLLPLAKIFQIAISFGKIGYHSTCTYGGNAMAMLEFMVDQMEHVAEAAVDEAMAESIHARASDLLLTLQREQTNLDNAATMSPEERAQYAAVVQGIGNTASQIEAEAGLLAWPMLPVVAVVGSIKNGAYVLAHELSAEGSYRDYLRETLIPQERQESVDLIAKFEKQLTREVVDDLKVDRFSAVYKGAGCSICSTDKYVVKTHAKHRDQYLYSKDWECNDKWIEPGNQCSHYGARRTEYFDAARHAMEETRGDLASVLEPEYLGVKNALSMYRGTSFTLVNNMVDEMEVKCLDPHDPRPLCGTTMKVRRCLDPDGGAVGAFVRLEGCDQKAHDDVWPADSDQLWRFRRGTSQVQNVKTGLCLDPQGYPDEDVPGAVVQLGECAADENDPDHVDQQWGMHPLGYLVNLHMGTCVDLQGEGATAKGTTARLWECEYELGPNGPGRSGGSGTDTGLMPGDPVTDQVWTMRYRGQNLPGRFGMANPPPPGLDTALPVAVDDHLDLAQDGGAMEADVLANDTDADGGPMLVESVTQPGNGVAAIVDGGAAVRYEPAAGYCNDDGPADEFSYVLNGGSTATVSVAVTCVDEPPVTDDDPAPAVPDVGGADADGPATSILKVKRKPKRDRTTPYRFRVKGKVKGDFDDDGNCAGKVKIKVKKRGRKILVRRASLAHDCTFVERFRLTEKRLQRKGLPVDRRLKLRMVVKYMGSESVMPAVKRKRIVVR